MTAMTDDTLISSLHSLGLDEDNVHAIVLLPLFEVAWADGRLHEPERRAILEFARKRGILETEAALPLETWLRYRPSDRYMARGREVLTELAARGHQAGITPETLTEVVSFCEVVAIAASGLLGRALKSIDAEEKKALAEIAGALSIKRQARWEDVAADLELARQALEEDDDTTVLGEGDPREVAASMSARKPARSPSIRRLKPARALSDRPPPAVLVHMKDGVESRVYRVGERGLSIGRRTDNDVVLPDDPQVSRLHCRIFRQGPRVYVVDCASAGGTWVNGERVHERRLLGDEELRVGQNTFLFTLGLLRD